MSENSENFVLYYRLQGVYVKIQPSGYMTVSCLQLNIFVICITVLDRLITIEQKLDMLISSDPEHEDNSLDLIWPEQIGDHDSLEAMEDRLEADKTFSRTLVSTHIITKNII